MYVCMRVCVHMYVWVCVWLCTWVSAWICLGGFMCVCADGCSKAGTYECMLNTSCTHVSAKGSSLPISSFLTQDASLYFNENYNLRSRWHQFSLTHSEVHCFILNKTAPYSVASNETTFWSLLHPYGTTPGVFKSSACEGKFNLINAFCWYETKNVSGIYRTFHNEIGEAGFEQLANVINFRVTDAVFPWRMYFFCYGEMLVKSLLMSQNRDRYTLFLPKLSAHTSSY